VLFREKQHVRVLDVGSCVCKSDTATLSALSDVFRQSVPSVIEQQRYGGKLDWRSSQVLSLVDPSLFPLVYGRSPVLVNGGKVDLQNIFDSHHNATTASKHVDRREHSAAFQKQIEEEAREDFSTGLRPHHRGDSNLKFYRWGSNYQYLPCEVEFSKDSGTEVQITSYINNLHPMHMKVYQAIEKLVSLAIKPWNGCLVKGRSLYSWRHHETQGQLGRMPLRIITYGVEWENELLRWAIAFNVPSEAEKRMFREAQEKIKASRKDKSPGSVDRYMEAVKVQSSLGNTGDKIHLELPPADSEIWGRAKAYLELPEDETGSAVEVSDDWAVNSKPWVTLKEKAERVVRFKHSEPGTGFSYKEWKDGRHNDKAIVEIAGRYQMAPHNPYSINLQDAFRKQGLQIIVKMENIELTPQAPIYVSDSWELEGQKNEHIAAVAIFTYDVANVTEPRIEYRQFTRLHRRYYQYREEPQTLDPDEGWRDSYPHRIGKSFEKECKGMANVLGFPPGNCQQYGNGYHRGLAFQNTGSVASLQGRLVTFPSVLEHRLKSFQLVDQTRPGHYRCIKVYLVDPHYRVCSTRNVPPQQHHWWAEEVGNDLASFGLPRELQDAIFQETTGPWDCMKQSSTDRNLTKSTVGTN
jgi:hypothetical protein